SQLVTKELRKLGYADARGELIDMSDYGVPQRRQRFIVIATRQNLADDIFDALDTQRAERLKEMGIPRRNTVKSALSDLQRCHGETVCPDSPRFNSGITSHSRTGLQKHLRTSSVPHTPDSHRFVNHTDDVEAVFERLLADAPRNR